MKNWKENDLFNYLLMCCYPDLQKAKKQMSRWDCYSVENRHRIELKCRRNHYNELLIERKKYDAMILKSNENLDIPIYINSTPEGVYSFNLFKVVPQWFVAYHNKTTEFSNTKKIAKQIAMLPITEAEIL
jgi:hypothetical protein|tara:strand:- start:690 stop:1079 length:390 start_codon:yes stop_codon:yes gene_type:complete